MLREVSKVTANILAATGHWFSSTVSTPSTAIDGGSPRQSMKAVPVGDSGSVVVGMWAGGRVDVTPLDAPDTRPGNSQDNEQLVMSVLFRPSDSRLEPGARQELRTLARLLCQTPLVDIHLHGHADARGPRKPNQRLSQLRVTSVQRLLNGEGVGAHRIHCHAHGNRFASHCTSDMDGLVFDRRVLIRCTSEGLHHV